MSKRLQVVLHAREYVAVERAAKRSGMTTSAWVRQALRAARESVPGGNATRKLQVVRAAAEHGFPTADIDQMLAEIERGYVEAR